MVLNHVTASLHTSTAIVAGLPPCNGCCDACYEPAECAVVSLAQYESFEQKAQRDSCVCWILNSAEQTADLKVAISMNSAVEIETN